MNRKFGNKAEFQKKYMAKSSQTEKWKKRRRKLREEEAQRKNKEKEKKGWEVGEYKKKELGE